MICEICHVVVVIGGNGNRNHCFDNHDSQMNNFASNADVLLFSGMALKNAPVRSF